MVRDIDCPSAEPFEKVLVCITAQTNSKRLINKGAEIADRNNAELHIVHVLKGSSIFNNSETPKLLEQLFQYGSEKGGMVHMFCNEDIPQSIAGFIENEKMTKIVLGEPPKTKNPIKKNTETQFGGILNNVAKTVEVIIVSRDDED